MVTCSGLSSGLDRVLGGDGVSAHQREHLAFHLRAALLYSSAEKFCAELIEPLCLEEIIQLLSDARTAPSVQEPLGS